MTQWHYFSVNTWFWCSENILKFFLFWNKLLGSDLYCMVTDRWRHVDAKSSRWNKEVIRATAASSIDRLHTAFTWHVCISLDVITAPFGFHLYQLLYIHLHKKFLGKFWVFQWYPNKSSRYVHELRQTVTSYYDLREWYRCHVLHAKLQKIYIYIYS